MLERLQYNNEEGRDVRAELDAWLDVPRWRTPMRHALPVRQRAIDLPDVEPPPWWESDEEASASFLSQMGVSLDGD